MKLFAILFVALFAVVAGRTVIDNVDGNELNFDDEIDNRVIGGDSTTIGQHPHQISFGHHFKLHLCGGAILSPIRAITAASCFLFKFATPSEYYIQAGSNKPFWHESPESQVRVLSRFVIHERFDIPRDLNRNNIVVLFWKEPLIFGANVRAIRLPAANAPLPYGQEATLSGWGNGVSPNDKLQAIAMPVVNDEVCNRTMGGKMLPGQFCSGGVRGQGACEGDIGGPLVHNNILIGILSGVDRPCASVSDVFTHVAYFIDWIKKHPE